MWTNIKEGLRDAFVALAVVLPAAFIGGALIMGYAILLSKF